MTKAELVDKVASTLPFPKRQTATVVALFLQCITGALRKRDHAELRGFGSFRLRHRRPRVARNPRTGVPVQLPATKAPWFTAGKALRVLVDHHAQSRLTHDANRSASTAAVRAARGLTTRVSH